MEDGNVSQQWFFTAPHEPVLVRRGDPLGFRGIADWYADLLAPGLSNRTYDGRWLTILVWVLHQANHAWQHFHDGEPLDSAEAARRFYEWVKPLELLWVARTATLCEAKGRQLPGIRGVNRWLDDETLPNIGLSLDQYRRYRQTGIYGAYRVMLRRVRGLTKQGDGFRPENTCHELVNMVDRDVPRVHLRMRERRRIPDPVRYWSEAWPAWYQLRRGKLFPTLRASPQKLTPMERTALCPKIFGDSATDPDAQRRRQVAIIVGGARAKKHSDLCKILAERLEATEHTAQLRVLPKFSLLADAGVDAMDAIWSELSGEPQCLIRRVSSRVAGCLDHLAEAARKWKSLDGGHLSGEAVVRRLADAICDARSDEERTLTLVRHHEQFGGGLRWFSLAHHSTQLVRIAPERPTETSRYRFRLYALGRLAIQCGVIERLPPAPDFLQNEEE
jgi:hypothetical protein